MRTTGVGSPERVNRRNGYRERDWDMRVGLHPVPWHDAVDRVLGQLLDCTSNTGIGVILFTLSVSKWAREALAGPRIDDQLPPCVIRITALSTRANEPSRERRDHETRFRRPRRYQGVQNDHRHDPVETTTAQNRRHRPRDPGGEDARGECW